jgi:DNA-binding transcriptional ArsR family regulator/type II secretory pathway predicted ATPase ExeA
MDRDDYYRKFRWSKSPFIKSTSLDIPIIGRMDEYNEVCECIGGWDRIMVITAPIGYGKTTFMNQLVMDKPAGVGYVVAFNSFEPEDTVMRRIKEVLPFYKRFFFKPDRTTFGEILQRSLGTEKMLIIFDEAQDYDNDIFKWLRIMNDRTDNLFMIFLGLPGLEDKITSETSFRDRKSKSIRLRPFELEDLEELVKERIEWAGGKSIAPFTKDGLRRLCESSGQVPRQLLENGQRVIEECATKGIESADATFVENVLGMIEAVIPAQKPPENTQENVSDPDDDSEEEEQPAIEKPREGVFGFMEELSPTQQDIVNLLLQHESLSISELSEILKKDIRSIGSLIRKLRGLNKMEVSRKPNVPYPVIIRKGKETRVGRLQYVYTLSDNARRLLAKK